VAAILVAVAGSGTLARPAAANHQATTLWVTIAINAAGGDRLTVTDDGLASTGFSPLASDVALALDRPAGSFRSVEDIDGAHVLLEDKLAQRDGRGGLRFALDTGKLQLVAQDRGYDAVAVEVCTPWVRQVVDAMVAPEASPNSDAGSRCRGWYKSVDDPPIRAVVQLAPDRHRYPLAVGRVVGTAAITFGLLGIGATLLRRGPMRRRSWVSWFLACASVLAVLPIGWGATTLALWWSGAVADPMLLGGGQVGEQVARTMVPGLVFVLPALLPASVLLSVARREPPPRVAAPLALAPGPPAPAWWPTAWWSLWAAQGGPAPRPPAPPPAPGTQPPGGPGDPTAPSGWALPGSHDG